MFTLTEEEATARHGAIVYRDDYRVIRAKVTEDRLTVVIHDCDAAGAEILPNGYLAGANIIWHKAR